MRRQRLPFLDFIGGLAIVSIIFYHALIQYGLGEWSFLAYFGLSLFTLASAYKFYYHNYSERTEPAYREFIRKRAVRLYKPYLGYSLLMLPASLIVFTLLSAMGNPSYLTTLITDISDPWTYVEFIFGLNFISYQLWYLVALLYCNVIVGFAFIKYRRKGALAVFLFFISLLITKVAVWPSDEPWPLSNDLVLSTMTYVPIFVIGIGIAKSVLDNELTRSYWLIPACLLYVAIGYWAFALSVMAFLLIFYLRESSLVKRESVVSKFSFQIYLFHWPLILPGISILMTMLAGIQGIVGVFLASFLTIALCPLAYLITKKIRLNILFE